MPLEVHAYRAKYGRPGLASVPIDYIFEHTSLFSLFTSEHGTEIQVGRSQVRFPMVSLEFFIDIILSATL